MGKKVKIGKQRRDKAYWSAKEIGFRSRASFKLIQLNRKFEFLQKSRVCIDLCAAPGSWMQVAKEHMPLSSLIIGVDLVPIKAIPGCISMVNDITTDKCRADLKKELQGWKTDLVLHDGAPNVGKSWIHDAYQQSLITLAAFKLATEFLREGGTFVTKVFRSKDYQSLLWVFNQFFKKVHSTKPPASRAESAEIFVVCQFYKAPDKIDPRFLDPKSVFSEVSVEDDPDKKGDNELINPEKRKKAPADGYEDKQVSLLYKNCKASDFIEGENPIHILNNCHQIIMDTIKIQAHPKTSPEIVACCQDIKVLGMKELRLIKKWRECLKKEFQEEKEELNKKDKDEPMEDDKDEDEEEDDEELKKLENEIMTLNDEERRLARRKKKQLLKEKRKRAEKINLKMVIPGDEGPTMQEEGLFNIKDLKSGREVAEIEEGEPDMYADDSDDDTEKKPKLMKYSKKGGTLDKSGLFYKDDSESDENNSDESDSDKEDLGLEEEKNLGKNVNDEDVDKFNDPSANPLLLDLDTSDRNARRQKKAEMWFDKDVFQGMEDDDDLEEAEINNAIKALKNKGGSLISEQNKNQEKQKVVKKNSKKSEEESGYTSESEDSDESDGEDSDSDSDSDYDMNSFHRNNQPKEKEGFDVVPKQKIKKRKALTPEELALGQEMIKSKKRKRDLLDAGWNRYMFNDKDEDLPDWFVYEEQYHMKPRVDLDPSTVEYYREKQKEMNVKTIKKVVEAKARKKRRLSKKMDKAKKRAAAIMENTDIGNREKVKEINRMYKKATAKETKQVTYTVAKKHKAAKRASRPAGVKGLYKQVDPRMKKDNTTKRSNATNKRNRKRTLKGKKTRPKNFKA